MKYIDSRVILQKGNAAHIQKRYRDTEQNATRIRSFQPTLVLEVLQTRAYATAVFASNHEIVDREDAAAAVDSRMTRWELLTDPAKHWHLIQTEAALRWIVRSPSLMAKQLDRIAEASRLPNVHLGIIRLDTVSYDPQPSHGFHIYDEESVTFGTESGVALLSSPKHVAFYAEIFDDLTDLADYGDEVRHLLADLAANYRAIRQ
jgi:hypothetical protein